MTDYLKPQEDDWVTRAVFWKDHFSNNKQHRMMHQHLGGDLSLSRWWRIHLPTQKMQEMRVWSLGQEDTLEEEMATHPNILACKISMDRGAWRLHSMKLQTVWHNWGCEHRSWGTNRVRTQIQPPRCMDPTALSIRTICKGPFKINLEGCIITMCFGFTLCDSWEIVNVTL